jgi:hypothetical protein
LAVSSGIVTTSAKEEENAEAAMLPMKLLRCPEGDGGDILPVFCSDASRRFEE